MKHDTFFEKCFSFGFAVVLAAFAFVLFCGGIAILFESGALSKHQAESQESTR
jgi:hypothetical protein